MLPITKSNIDSIIIEEIKEYLGEDIENVYHFPNREFANFCYFEDFLWIHLFAPDVKFMKQSRLKELIEQRRKHIQSSLEKKKFKSLLSMTENIIKISMFKKYFEDIPDADKYDIFQSVYKKSEYNFQEFDREFLEKILSYREWSISWKENIQSLVDKTDEEGWLTVYRGQGTKSTPLEDALSWSLSKNVAHFFANRFDKNGWIWKANVHISDIWDFLPERNEEEVLVEYDRLCNIERIK